MTSCILAPHTGAKEQLLPKFERSTRIALAALIIVFLGQLAVFGYYICPDTKKYIAFSSRVNFLYPWYLAALRTVFGEEQYFIWCAIVQNLFLAWAIFSLCEYLQRELDLTTAGFWGITFTAAACFLLQLVFTSNGIFAPNVIFSEGLAYPLYLLLAKYFFAGWRYPSKKLLCLTALFSFLLIGTRGQLSWTLLLILALGIRTLRAAGRSCAISCVATAALAAAVFLLCSALNTASNAYKNGFGQNATMGRSVVLATAIWCSEPEDTVLFSEDSPERAFLEEVNAFIDEKGCAARYAPDELITRFYYFTDRYDTLKDALSTFMLNHVPLKELTLFSIRIALRLAAHRPLALLRHTSMNFLAGAVRSVAIFSPMFIILAALFYLITLVTVLMCRKTGILAAECRLMLGALSLTTLNCWFVSLGVFALPRYMFYNLPLLYISAEILFLRLLLQFFRKKSAKQT